MDLFFLVFAFIAEVIGTIAGFGSSTVLLPVSLFIFDYKTALVLVAFLHILGSISRIAFFRQGIDGKLFIAFGAPSIVFSFLGAVLVSYISSEIFKALVGVFLIFYAVLAFAKNDLRVSSRNLNIAIGGSITGFFTGLIGTGGALRGAFLTVFRVDKEKYIATASAVALVTDLARIPVYLQLGFLSREYYFYLPLLVAIAFLGTYAGKQIVDRIPQETFRKAVLTALFLIGVKFTVDYFL